MMYRQEWKECQGYFLRSISQHLVPLRKSVTWMLSECSRFLNTVTDLLKALSYGTRKPSLLLGKHVLTNGQPTIEGHPLLGNGPVDTSCGNTYAAVGEVVFSVVRAVLVAM
jgi:hypothetical protein